jgi:hypothetical protein
MRRILIIGAAAVLAVVALARFVLVPALARAVARTVEARGSELMATAVQVEDSALDLGHRQAILSNLRVGNPKGFHAEHALAVERVVVTVAPATLRSDPVVLKEVVVEGPTLIYEFAANDNNIAVIRRAIEAKIAAQEKEPMNGGEGRDPRLVVERLRVTRGKVRIVPQFLGGQELTASLSDVEVDSIGATMGTSVPRVVEEVLATLTRGVRSNLRQLNLHGGSGPSGSHP